MSEVKTGHKDAWLRNIKRMLQVLVLGMYGRFGIDAKSSMREPSA